jgi:hypothetical protein
MINRSTRFPNEYPFRETPADHLIHPMIVKNRPSVSVAGCIKNSAW